MLKFSKATIYMFPIQLWFKNTSTLNLLVFLIQKLFYVVISRLIFAISVRKTTNKIPMIKLLRVLN